MSTVSSCAFREQKDDQAAPPLVDMTRLIQENRPSARWPDTSLLTQFANRPISHSIALYDASQDSAKAATYKTASSWLPGL